MKNEDILLLDQALPTIDVPEMDGWFNYAVEENIQRASSKAKSIMEVIKPKGKMAEYQEKVKELQITHAEKDEYDNPQKITRELGDGRVMERYVIADIENPKHEFNIAIEKLEEEYKKAIEAHEKKLKFLEEENSDFEPFFVTISQIPKGLSRRQMKAVRLMTDPSASKEKKD